MYFIYYRYILKVNIIKIWCCLIEIFLNIIFQFKNVIIFRLQKSFYPAVYRVFKNMINVEDPLFTYHEWLLSIVIDMTIYLLKNKHKDLILYAFCSALILDRIYMILDSTFTSIWFVLC